MSDFVAVPTALGDLQLSVPGLEFEAGEPGHPVRGVWHLGRSRVTLRVDPWQPAVPAGMRLDGGWLLVWTLDAEAALPGLILQAELVTAPVDGGPASGEGLDARTWVANGIELSLGTYDGERLVARAHAGRGLPRWWAPLLEDTYPVGHLEGGLALYPPHLDGGERAMLHLAVAWCAHETDDNLTNATWFAVDVPEPILEHLSP